MEVEVAVEVEVEVEVEVGVEVELCGNVVEWHGDAFKIRDYAICYRMNMSRASGTACGSVLGLFCVLW